MPLTRWRHFPSPFHSIHNSNKTKKPRETKKKEKKKEFLGAFWFTATADGLLAPSITASVLADDDGHLSVTRHVQYSKASWNQLERKSTRTRINSKRDSIASQEPTSVGLSNKFQPFETTQFALMLALRPFVITWHWTWLETNQNNYPAALGGASDFMPSLLLEFCVALDITME